MLAFVCFIFTVSSPPYSPVDPAATVDVAVGYDYYADDPAPTTELPGKQSPSPIPDIAYLSIFIFALGIAAATLHSYSLHSLSLSPLDVPSFILCCLLLLCIIQQLALRIVSQLGLDSGP